MFPDHTALLGTDWYVARRISIAPPDATHALGEALRTDAVEPATGSVVSIREVRHTRPGEARGFSGRLRLGPLAPAMPVEVEIEPWSRSESVLGIRPMRRVPIFHPDRYFDRALVLLADLETCVRDRVSVVAELPEVRRAS
jgi:hypothetical protein